MARSGKNGPDRDASGAGSLFEDCLAGMFGGAVGNVAALAVSGRARSPGVR